jgi:hypothetical protein
LEFQCTPDSESFVVERELSFTRYVELLARRFNVPKDYLVSHQSALANYRSFLEKLQVNIEDESLTSEERESAQRKFDFLTEKGGILDRFNQALSIKRALEWPKTDDDKRKLVQDEELSRQVTSLVKGDGEDPLPPSGIAEGKFVVTLEKSVRKFEQALHPINFAKILKGGSPDKIIEPSTGRTWVLASTSASFAEALVACSKVGKGFRIPSYSNELQAASEWLADSSIGTLMPVLNGEKFVWLDESIQIKKIHQGKKQKTIQTSPNSSRTGEFDYYYHTYVFPAAAVHAERSRKTTVDHATTEEEELTNEQVIEKYGNNTTKLSVLCVGPTTF